MAEPKVPTKKASALGEKRAWPLLGMLVLAALLAVGTAVFLSGAFRQEPTQVSGDAGDSDLARQAVSPGEEPGSQADEDAPVVMIEYAERLGSDFASGRYEGVVSRDFEEATSKGIPGTPTFFVNEKPLVGAQPVEVFEEAIEEALQEQEAEDA